MCRPIKGVWGCLGLCVACLAAALPASGAEGPYAPQPQASLQRMLTIDWKKGPDLPQGFQDSAFGLIDRTLVTVGGFCQGTRPWKNGQELDVLKPGRYPRGFLDKVWMLSLNDPGRGWRRLPNFPGAARQGFVYAVVGDSLYCWGGFNYTAPYCYRDGARLSCREGRWSWTPMPALPWNNTAGAMTSIGSKIYLLGGSDYDSQKFFTTTDRTGKVQRLGARLLMLDTQNLNAGWKELAPCPGTPRFCHALTALDGKLYAIGGGNGDDNVTGKYATVVDNWRYDPAADAWTRLRDLPVASGNFPPGRLVAFNRYILLMCGYQYANIIGMDGRPRPVYGKPFQHYTDRDYYSDVFVYDTKTELFGTATPLPLNNAGPMTLVEGNHIHMIGGETAGSEIEGEKFGHHPDLYLIGTLHEGGRAADQTVLPHP